MIDFSKSSNIRIIMPTSPSARDERNCDIDVPPMAASKPAYFTEVGANDVLLGRGAPIINNQGNVRFRELVTARKARYWSSGRSERKTSIATEIIEIIAKRDGKFLEKVEDAQSLLRMGLPPGTDAWTEVEDFVVVKKVKQALRENKSRYQGLGQEISGVENSQPLVSGVETSNLDNHTFAASWPVPSGAIGIEEHALMSALGQQVPVREQNSVNSIMNYGSEQVQQRILTAYAREQSANNRYLQALLDLHSPASSATFLASRVQPPALETSLPLLTPLMRENLRSLELASMSSNQRLRLLMDPLGQRLPQSMAASNSILLNTSPMANIPNDILLALLASDMRSISSLPTSTTVNPATSTILASLAAERHRRNAIQAFLNSQQSDLFANTYAHARQEDSKTTECESKANDIPTLQSKRKRE